MNKLYIDNEQTIYNYKTEKSIMNKLYIIIWKGIGYILIYDISL